MLNKERIAGFEALLASHKENRYHIEDVDGNHTRWKDMSSEAKLSQIARDAAYYDVPFNAFVKSVREEIGSGKMTAREEAALRLILRVERELHVLDRMLPDNQGTVSTPLVDRVEYLLDYISALETKEEQRRGGRQEPSKKDTSVRDGKSPSDWLESTSLAKGSGQVEEAKTGTLSLAEQFRQMLNDPTPGPAQRSEGKEPEQNRDRGREM